MQHKHPTTIKNDFAFNMKVEAISTPSSEMSSLSNEVNIPEEFICPLTQEIMKNPLMSRYGQTYERDAILTWLSNHNNLCPFTKQELKLSDLVRHRALETRIEVWKKVNGMIPLSSSHYKQEDNEDVHILLTCRTSDLLSYSDHNPKTRSISPKSRHEEPQEEKLATRQRQQQRRLGQRILRLIVSSR